ncbi:MAG TPA: ATP-binding protein [Planctomycetaceae bacterium]|nr:ATP-binding protein [Planctomycetaceae bacterium]
MTVRAMRLPLTRRLVTSYLAFGLAGLFLALAITVLLIFQERMADFAPLAAIIPLAVLGVGAIVLNQTVRFHADIERQLIQISSNPGDERIQFQSLNGNEPAIVGWNTLLERIATRDALSALEQRLSASLASRRDHRAATILQTLSDGVVLTETGGRILYANRALAVLLQCESADELLGKNLMPLLRVQEAHNAEAVLAALFSNSANAVFELRRTKESRDGVLRIARHLTVDRESNESRVVWSIRDITQQMLVDESRASFVSLATHELRTPLANIKAYAETLAIHDGIDVEKQKEFCNIINAEATRLSRFVDEMLSISQIESGSLVFEMRETDLERMLHDVVEHVRPQMDQKQITLEVKLPPKFPSLRLDKDKFEAALVNLLGNAAKYTPAAGKVRFEVQYRGQNVDFVVKDSGIGIAKEEQARVFDKFFRSGDERVREVDGNGLGLTFTQEVVHSHGGQLSLESELNQGSTFTVSLPLPSAGDR